MATFQQRIEDYIGTLVSADTAFMADSLTTGARIVIDHLAVKSSDKLELYATDKASSGGVGGGVDITGGRAISAHKSNYPARRIPAEMVARLSDAGSIHFALPTDPAWYIDKKKAYVLPTSGIVRWVAYPAVTHGLSAISDFPPEGYPAIVLYAAIQYEVRLLSDLVTSTLGGIVIVIPTAVTAPSAPKFSYVAALAATVGTTTISFTDSLEFKPPVFAGSYNSMDTALTNQDVELAQGYNQKIQSQLGQYSNDLQNAAAKFQEDLQEYQLGLQKATENARLESTKYAQQAQLTTDVRLQNQINIYRAQVDEYAAVLGRYQGEVGIFGTRVQAEIARVQALIAQYALMAQTYLQVLENLRKEFQISLESL